MDLVILDEFNEPMHYASTPIKLTGTRLFENQLNLDMAAELEEKETKLISIKYEYFSQEAGGPVTKGKPADVIMMM